MILFKKKSSNGPHFVWAFPHNETTFVELMSEFEEAFCNSTKKSMTFKNGTVLEEGNKFLMRQILGDGADLDCKEGTVQVIFDPKGIGWDSKVLWNLSTF